MSVNYAVSCRDCMITRQLGTFYSLMLPASTVPEMRALAKDLEHRSFQAALLASFLWAHAGHHCTLYNDDEPALDAVYDACEPGLSAYQVVEGRMQPVYGTYQEDVDFLALDHEDRMKRRE